ncbi:MAG: transcriptional regulatory protein RtcR [Cryomorphaceae bacterium]|jgi:transcriptional regulatory protein RtcR
MTKSTTVIGFLGTKLDAFSGRSRWTEWRPTVNLCGREDFLIDRYELLYEQDFSDLAESVMQDMRQISPETEVVGRLIGITKPWDFEDVFSNLYDYFKSLHANPSQTNYYAHITTGTHVAQICLFLLTESQHLPGKLIQTGPPRGRSVGKKPGSFTIIDLDLSKYDLLAARFHEEKSEAQDILKSGIATLNKKFNALIEQIETVALRSDAPILITGPTGAGKSQLVEKVYQLRQSRCGVEGNFVEINCATLRGDMAMSTLFGHKKGSFTGAATDRQGLLREANGGILFLDEIGELGADEQAILLRAIEEGRWLPVGSDTPVKSKFQLIAGTNKDLRVSITEGVFREDLLARINTWTFRLPGLAERLEDIAPNIDYELSKQTETSGQSIRFNKEAYENFLEFATDPKSSWSGNFRDLNAAITRMATLAPRGRIRTEEVADEKNRLRENWMRPGHKKNSSELTEFLSNQEIEHIDPFDRPQLSYVIQLCKTSKSISDAGRHLFSVSREQRKSKNDGDRLRKYLAKFGLSFEDF